MKIIIKTLLASLLILSFDLEACSCLEMKYKKMFKFADFVLIGRPIKNIHPDTVVGRLLDNQNGGTELLFKVEKVLKGDLKLREVVIYQIGKGSCTEWLRIGDKYLIFGHTFNKAQAPIGDFNATVEIDSLTGKQEVVYVPSDTISNLRIYMRTIKNSIDIVYTGSCSIFGEKTNFYYDNRRRYSR